jgi:hypothetical protein
MFAVSLNYYFLPCLFLNFQLSGLTLLIFCLLKSLFDNLTYQRAQAGEKDYDKKLK